VHSPTGLDPAALVPAGPERFLSVTPRPRDARHVVIDVVGHVDAFTAPLLRACLRTQLSRPGLRGLTLDVGGVDVLGAPGVAVIVEAARRCRRRGLGFRVRARGRGQVLLSLEAAGVVTGFRLEQDVVAVPPLTGSVARA